MKWFRDKEQLEKYLLDISNDLFKYKNEKLLNVLRDMSNLIKDHLELLKIIEIIKTKDVSPAVFLDSCCVRSFNREYSEQYHLSKEEYSLLEEVLRDGR